MTNGTISGFAGAGASYSFNVAPTGSAMSVSVAAGVAQDAAGNTNSASAVLARTYDGTAPTVSLTTTASNPTNISSIPVTVTFSESVTGFVAGDITVTNGTINGFAGAGASYSFNVAPTGSAVSISVAAGVAQDAAGNTNAGPATLARTYDNVAPTVTILTPTPMPVRVNQSTPANFVVSYGGADSISLASGHVSLSTSGGVTCNIPEVTDTGVAERTVTLTGCTGNGTVAITILSGSASDLAGNSAPASAMSWQATVDNTAPTINVVGPTPTTVNSAQTAVYTVNYTGADFVSLAPENIILSKTGTASCLVSVTGAGTASRTVSLTQCTGAGTVGFTIDAGTASDLASNISPAGTGAPVTVSNGSISSPYLDSVTPASGSLAGGTAITIQGGQFQTNAQVMIGDAVCSMAHYISPSQMTCITPNHVTPGLVSVVVTNPDTGQASANLFTYQATAEFWVTGTMSSSNASGVLYDSGGPSGNYTGGDSSSFKIIGTVGSVITLQFTDFDLENMVDYLRVYDGASSAGTLLAEFTGASIPSTVKAYSGNMYIQISTNSTVHKAGFRAVWITSPAGAPKANFTVSPANAEVGSVINFQDTSTGTGISSWEWDFGWDSNPDLENEGVVDSTAQNPSHAYPASGIRLVSLTVRNAVGMDTIRLPVRVSSYLMTDGSATSLKGTLYDAGGPFANYGPNDRNTFQITPTGASMITLNFNSFIVTADTYFYIYNSTSTQAKYLIWKCGGTTSCATNIPTSITSNTGQMTIQMDAYDSTNETLSGFEANWIAQ